MDKKLISIIVPVYNEQESLPAVCDELCQYLEKTHPRFEVILVDDGSSDNSMQVVRKLSKKYKKINYMSFSRNFGKEAATTAGLHSCRGEAAIMMDADGQHPKELIGEMLERWANGFEVVVGIRTANQKEGFIKRYGSKFFYKVLNGITENNTVPGSTDFRLVDRKVIDEFNKLTEHNRITRGLIDWLGFKRTYLPFQAHARVAGEAAYSYKKLVRLALHALVSQSTRPLQTVGVVGVVVTMLSAVLLGFVGLEQFLLDDPLNLAVSGTAILAIFLSFLVGIVLACQGLLALYVESIHAESQNRPLYIIDEASN